MGSSISLGGQLIESAEAPRDSLKMTILKFMQIQTCLLQKSIHSVKLPSCPGYALKADYDATRGFSAEN